MSDIEFDMKDEEILGILKEAMEKSAAEQGLSEEDVAPTVEAAMEELEKSANVAKIKDAAMKLMNHLKMIGGNEKLRDTMASMIPKLAMGAGIVGANQFFNKKRSEGKRGEYEAALDFVIKSNTVLKQASRSKVERFGETVFRFAPNVATDVNLLSAILSTAIHGESMDPQMIKSLTDLESKFRGYDTFKARDLMV